MPALPSIPAEAWGFFALLVALGLMIYARVIRRIVAQGGQVRVAEFDLPELLMSFVFAGFFLATMAATLARAKDGDGLRGDIDVVLQSALLFVAFTAGILAFLHYARRRRIGELFGLTRLSMPVALAFAAGLVLAALPLASGANLLAMRLLEGPVTPQPLVELFSQVAGKGDRLAIAKIVFAGVIVAPICEELLFRGFFYGVWKRYLGPLGAGFLSCLLFAAFHTSLAAFAGLFVLAVCFNLAYERTGSLLVPIGMHALFNLLNLLVLFSFAGREIPAP